MNRFTTGDFGPSENSMTMTQNNNITTSISQHFHGSFLMSTTGFGRSSSTAGELRQFQEQIAKARLPILQSIEEALRHEEFGNPDEAAASMRRGGSSRGGRATSGSFSSGTTRSFSRENTANNNNNNNTNNDPSSMKQSRQDNTNKVNADHDNDDAFPKRPTTKEDRTVVSFVVKTSSIRKEDDENNKTDKDEKKESSSGATATEHDETKHHHDDNHNNNNQTEDEDDNNGTPLFSKKGTNSSSFRNPDSPTTTSLEPGDYKRRKTIEEQKQHWIDTGRTPGDARERAREQQLKRIEALKAEMDSSRARSQYAERWRSFAEKRKQAQFSLVWQTLLLQVIMMRRWDRERRVAIASESMIRCLGPVLKLKSARRRAQRQREEIIKNFLAVHGSEYGTDDKPELPPLTADLLMSDKLLAHFGRAHLASMIPHGKLKVFPKDFNLCYYGEPGRDCFALVHGEVDILVAESTGNTEHGQAKYELKPLFKEPIKAPFVLGAIGMVRLERRIAKLTCATDCIAYVIDHYDFMKEVHDKRVMEAALEEARRLHLENMTKTYGNTISPESLEKYYTLSKIPKEKLRRLATCFKSQIALPGQYIIRAGQRSSSLFILAEGKVDICPPADDFQTPHHINTANAAHMIDVPLLSQYESKKFKTKNFDRSTKLKVLDVFRPYGYMPTCDTPEHLGPDAAEKKTYSPVNPAQFNVDNQCGHDDQHNAQVHPLMVTMSLTAKATDSRAFIIGGPRFLLLDEYNMNVVVRKTADLFEISRDDFLKVMMPDPASLVATRDLSLKLLSQHVEKPRDVDVAAAVFAEFPTVKYSRRHLQDSGFSRRLQERAVIIPAGTSLQFNNHSKQNQEVLIVIRGEISRVSRKDGSGSGPVYASSVSGGRHNNMEDDSDVDNNHSNAAGSARRLRGTGGYSSNNKQSTSGGGGLVRSPPGSPAQHPTGSFTSQNPDDQQQQSGSLPPSLGLHHHRGAGQPPHIPLGRTGHRTGTNNNNNQVDGGGTFSLQAANQTYVKDQYLMWPSLGQIFYSNQTFAQTVTKRIEGFKVPRGEVLRFVQDVIGRDNEERQRLLVSAITKPYGGRLPAFFTMGVDDGVRETFMKWGAVKFLTKGDPGADAQLDGSGTNTSLNSSLSGYPSHSALNNNAAAAAAGSSSPNVSGSPILLGAKELQQLQQQHQLQNQAKQNEEKTSSSSPGSKPLSQTHSQSSLSAGNNKDNNNNNNRVNSRQQQGSSTTFPDHDNNHNNNQQEDSSILANSTNNASYSNIREGGKKISFVMHDGQIVEQNDKTHNHHNNNRKPSFTLTTMDSNQASASATPHHQSLGSISPSNTSVEYTKLPPIHHNNNNNTITSIDHHAYDRYNNNNNSSRKTTVPFSTDSYEAGSHSYQLAMQRFTRTMEEAINEKNEKLLHDMEVKKKKSSSSTRRRSSTSPFRRKYYAGSSGADITYGRRKYNNTTDDQDNNNTNKNNDSDDDDDFDNDRDRQRDIGDIDPHAIEARKLARGGVSHHPLAHFMKKASSSSSHGNHHHHDTSNQNNNNINNNSNNKITTSISTGPVWATASHSSTEINTSSLLNTGGGTLAATARISHTNNNNSHRHPLAESVSIPSIANLWALPGSNDIEGNFYGKEQMNNTNSSSTGGVSSSVLPLPPSSSSQTARAGRRRSNNNQGSDNHNNSTTTPRRKLLSQSVKQYQQHQREVAIDSHHPTPHHPTTPFDIARQSVIERTNEMKEKQRKKNQY